MNRVFLGRFACIAILASLCFSSISLAQKDPNVQKLAGRWEANKEKTKELIGEDSMADVAEVFEGKTILTMRENAALELELAGRTLDGMSFELEETENESEFEMTINGGPSGMTATVKWLDKDNIQFQPKNEKPVVFSRMKGEVEKDEASDEKEMKKDAVGESKATEVADAGEDDPKSAFAQRLIGAWNVNEEESRKMAKELGVEDQMPDSIPALSIEFMEGNELKFTEGSNSGSGSFEMLEVDENGKGKFRTSVEGDEMTISAEFKNGMILLQPETEFPLVFEKADQDK